MSPPHATADLPAAADTRTPRARSTQSGTMSVIQKIKEIEDEVRAVPASSAAAAKEQGSSSIRLMEQRCVSTLSVLPSFYRWPGRRRTRPPVVTWACSK